MQKSKKPLVSCVCVTRNRVPYLKRVIDNFRDQSYPNKELLILSDSDDDGTRVFLSSFKDRQIRWQEVPKMSLGNKRNLSVELAAGEYFCQWDDDDWYHRDRIGMQMDCLLRTHKSACVLGYVLLYNAVEKTAHLSSVAPWGSTIFCRKGVLAEGLRYPDLGHHEDTHFILDLLKKKMAVPLIMPSLYVYIFHGRNTFESAHFQQMFGRSQHLPDHIGQLLRAIHENKIAYIDACDLLYDKSILTELDYFHAPEGTIGI